MVARRGFVLLLIFVSLFCVIIVRLLWLQTLTTIGDGGLVGYLAQESVEQRSESVVLDQGRGRILDRSGAVLAGQQVHALLVVPQMPQWINSDLIGQVAAIIGVAPRVLDSQVRLTSKPFLAYAESQKTPLILSNKQIEQIDQIQSPVLKVVPYIRRYHEQPIAAHLIGFLGQNPRQVKELYKEELEHGNLQENDLLGASGLERTFDRFLQGIEPSRYVHFVDAKSEAIAGLHDRLISASNPFYPLQLRTTLDGKLQAETEAMLDNMHMKEGAVVVLDIKNSDVVVMASRPNYDPYSVLPELGKWRNRAVSAEVPGSIFKTVVLAAALEDGIVKPGQKFYCSGEWDRYHLRCWVREGHGVLTLEQAYAQSCNVIIAQIAAELDPGRLEEVAESLGLTHRIGWSTDGLSFPSGSIQQSFRQFDGEQEGQLFDQETPQADRGVLAQTGIGQRDVRLSPLQAANMVVTLLNAGKLMEPRIVSEIRHNNNRSLIKFPQHVVSRPVGKGGLSASTTRWLTEAMKLTVQSGTASSLLKVPVQVAGKTGTAEIGSSPNESKVNQWFIGYTPTDRPKYAFAILVSNRNHGAHHQALTITDQLIRLLDQ